MNLDDAKELQKVWNTAKYFERQGKKDEAQKLYKLYWSWRSDFSIKGGL